MNYKKIKLIQIEYFLALSRHLNFTEAAKSLYISQPSLSKQIALLEDSIGVELFYRNKRDVKLTTAGIVLLKEIGKVIEIIEGSIEKSRRASLEENITLNIGCLDAIDNSVFLTDIIKKVKKEYPTININLKKYSFKMLREKLINGSLDMAVTLSFEIDDSMGMVSNIIYKGNTVIIADKYSNLNKKEKIDINSLKSESFLTISRNESPNGFNRLINICRKNGFTPKIEKQLPNVESIVASVEVGMGVAILDSNFRLTENKNIKIYELQDNNVDIIMAWKKENDNVLTPIFSDYIVKDNKNIE